MECLVLGHSGTAGVGLESVDQTWPRRLAAAGIGCGVTAYPFFPVGDAAVAYALRRVRDASPDVVLLSLNAFPCAVPVVSASVRHRFGRRAERLYLRAEAMADRWAAARPRGGDGLRRAAQRAARAALGTRTMAGVDHVAAVYEDVLRELARLEGIQVVVLAEAMFGAEVQRRAPQMMEQVRMLRRRVRLVAEAHRFGWLDADGWLAPDDGLDDWQPDGVHLSARGHGRYADRLAAELVSGGFVSAPRGLPG